MREPARVVGFVSSALMLLVSFGVPFTDVQVSRIIGVVGAFLFLVGGEIVRNTVYSPATIERMGLNDASAKTSTNAD